MKKLIIMGAGGFGSEAAWVLEEMNALSATSERWEILGYADDDVAKKHCIFYDHKTLGTPDEVAASYPGQQLWYFCAIGNNKTRADVVRRLDSMGWKATVLVHPSVVTARKVTIGEGTYVGAGAILCPNAAIGRHVLINTKVTVGHDSVLADFSQACPGAQINGSCKIGQGAFIGSNASVFPGTSVGDYASVGANSQTVRSVRAGITVNGVPAMMLR